MIDLSNYKRIVILGVAGSGKSHMAKQLSAITGIPVTHLDNIFWLPDWKHIENEEFAEVQKEIIARDSWIIDGNYSSTLELRFKAADLVIFLDINRWRCMLSVIFRHGKKRTDLPEYLDEKYDKDFIDFLRWIYSYKNKGRLKILNMHEKFPDRTFMHIKSRREIRNLLKQ